MNNKLLIGILIGSITSSAMADSNLTQARGLVKQFAGTMKGELTKAMKSGGPVKAIEFCNQRAAGIAAETGAGSSWQIGRTSLKLRSPNNTPDEWELRVLNDFEARKASGADPKTLEFSETVTLSGQSVFRYMKAIPTQKPCLKCHAASIEPAIEAKLRQLYPDDRARGFNIGDIRGAFTLSKPL